MAFIGLIFIAYSTPPPNLLFLASYTFFIFEAARLYFDLRSNRYYYSIKVSNLIKSIKPFKIPNLRPKPKPLNPQELAAYRAVRQAELDQIIKDRLENEAKREAAERDRREKAEAEEREKLRSKTAEEALREAMEDLL